MGFRRFLSDFLHFHGDDADGFRCKPRGTEYRGRTGGDFSAIPGLFIKFANGSDGWILHFLHESGGEFPDIRSGGRAELADHDDPTGRDKFCDHEHGTGGFDSGNGFPEMCFAVRGLIGQDIEGKKLTLCQVFSFIFQFTGHNIDSKIKKNSFPDLTECHFRCII